MRKCILIIFNIIILGLSSVFAGQSFFYKEASLILGDYSSSLGFEYYKKYSGLKGDFLTKDIQIRIVHKENEDVFLEVHNAWLEYKLNTKYKLRIGHFDPYFGLEPVQDTHSTILQTLALDHIGFKKDWGFAIRWVDKTFDYDVSFQLGSGMHIINRNENYLVTSRIGNPRYNSFKYGLSLLYGRVLNAGNITFKKRIGLDYEYLLSSYNFIGELIYGQEDNRDVYGYLVELNYIIPRLQNLAFQAQFKSWDYDDILTFGLSYEFNNKTKLRLYYTNNNKVLLQYYFFGV